MKHLINWIEIPVLDISRATKFYNIIFNGIDFHMMEMGGTRYALFPSEDKSNAGALVQGPYHRPNADGVIAYLDGGVNMDEKLKRVDECGGKVIMPKTYLGNEAGYVGLFMDSEGNKIGLQHS